MNISKAAIAFLASAAFGLLISSAAAQEHEFLSKTVSSTFSATIAHKPFGMKVQAHHIPRVDAVVSGSPADTAGVKAGFVLTAIGGRHVDAQDWFDVMQKAPIGTVLTFDTTANKPAAPIVAEVIVPDELDKGFIDFHCTVKEAIPFGMEISESRDGHPTVQAVGTGTPAEAAGVKTGDVLLGVARHATDTSSWLAAFQKATLPFGLHFRRPAAMNVQNPTQIRF